MYNIELREDNIDEVIDFYTENLETCIEFYKEEEGRSGGFTNEDAAKILIEQKLNMLEDMDGYSTQPFRFDFYFVFKHRTIYDYLKTIKDNYTNYNRIEPFLLLTCIFAYRSIEGEIYDIGNINYDEDNEVAIYRALIEYRDNELARRHRRAKFEAALSGDCTHSLDLFYINKYVLEILLNTFASNLAFKKSVGL